jgi:hypothetical protein
MVLQSFTYRFSEYVANAWILKLKKPNYSKTIGAEHSLPLTLPSVDSHYQSELPDALFGYPESPANRLIGIMRITQQ